MNEFRIGLEPLIKGETFKGAQNFALNKAGRHGSDIKAKLWLILINKHDENTLNKHNNILLTNLVIRFFIFVLYLFV